MKRDLLRRYERFISKYIPKGNSAFISKEIFYSISPIDNSGPLISSNNGKEWLQFSTNDYLGLSKNNEIRIFASEFVKKYGIGTPMGPRPLTGTTEIHLQLEEEIARFKKTESALTFSVGANVMTGAIGTLVTKGDLVVIDQYAHTSLLMGARVSGAQIQKFKHNDINQLEDIIKSANSKQKKLVIVDGVYSMTGDVAFLPDICDICDKYKALLFVDDAHGNGVLGEGGRGVAELQKVEDRIDIAAGTFSKAFGSSGGFIASKKVVIDYLRFTTYTNIFTKAQPAVFAAVALKALEFIYKGKHLRQRILENTKYLHNRLREMGFNIGNSTTPITPIIFPGKLAIFLAYELRENYGIWVSPIVFPAIPIGISIIRVISTALHTKKQIDYFCDSLKYAHDKLTSGN